MLLSTLKKYLCMPRMALLKWAFSYYLVNVPIFWLLSSRYFMHGLPTDVLGLTFVTLTLISHIALLGLIFILIPSALLILLFPKKYFILPASILMLLFLISYLTIDSSVFLNYRFHLNGIILQMIFSSAFSQIFDFSWLEWSLAILFLALVIACECWLAFWLLRKQTKTDWRTYPIISLTLLVIVYGISQSIYAWTSAAYIYENKNYAQSTLNAAARFPLYYGMTAKDFLLGHRWIIPEKNNNMMLANLTTDKSASTLHYPLQPITTKAVKEPLNILLIVLDTWRADMMTPETTPHIYEFAQHATQYTHHYSGGDCTEPGIFSLLYGIPASYWPDFLAEHRGPVLIDELIKQHYDLAVYASASLYKPDFYQTAFVNVPNLKLDNPQPAPWQRDEYITQEMLTFLKNRHTSKPFFGFLFYDAIHEYDMPPHFNTKFNPWWKTINHLELNNNFDPTQYLNRYKNSVLYVDSLVTQILDTLQKQQLLNNTIVIITADHGEEFNDNHKNYWGHASNFSHVQMQTPFIVYWPKQPPAIHTHFTTHYDVVPLLMRQVLGVTNPVTDYSIGQPLTSLTGREIIPVSSYVFNGFIEYESNKITTLLGGGLYHVTNDKLEPMEYGDTANIQHLQTAFEMMHRYYQ